jgi:RNA polymerase sigma-70 factor, ECF subfamily
MDVQERFARGDRDAFEELFRQFQGEVYRWVMRIVRDRGIAEDLTVESFWRMYRAHARFDPSKSFGAWARRIATNLALDHLRKAKRERALVDEPADALAGHANPGLRRETRERIAEAFERLAPKLRVVARLSLIEEAPHREIAEALGISDAAVRVRLFRATRILRQELKELVEIHGPH